MISDLKHVAWKLETVKTSSLDIKNLIKDTKLDMEVGNTWYIHAMNDVQHFLVPHCYVFLPVAWSATADHLKEEPNWYSPSQLSKTI